jgi:hypothetical protein
MKVLLTGVTGVRRKNGGQAPTDHTSAVGNWGNLRIDIFCSQGLLATEMMNPTPLRSSLACDAHQGLAARHRGTIMSRIFIDARNPSRADETALLFGHVVKPASWRERLAIFWFVGLGVAFWAAVVLALFG